MGSHERSISGSEGVVRLGGERRACWGSARRPSPWRMCGLRAARGCWRRRWPPPDPPPMGADGQVVRGRRRFVSQSSGWISRCRWRSQTDSIPATLVLRGTGCRQPRELRDWWWSPRMKGVASSSVRTVRRMPGWAQPDCPNECRHRCDDDRLYASTLHVILPCPSARSVRSPPGVSQGKWHDGPPERAKWLWSKRGSPVRMIASERLGQRELLSARQREQFGAGTSNLLPRMPLPMTTSPAATTAGSTSTGQPSGEADRG